MSLALVQALSSAAMCLFDSNCYRYAGQYLPTEQMFADSCVDKGIVWHILTL